MASWVERMVGAAKLDAATFEEVEADTTATVQAMGVVILAAVAAGIGEIGYGGLGVIVGAAASLVGWVAWAFLTWLIGTKFLPEPGTQADVGQLMRTIGFATSPGIIRVLGWIPYLGTLIEIAAWVWMLGAMVVAVRHALDYKSTGRAILVCAIGWIANAIIVVSLMAILGIAVIGVKNMTTGV
jgi:Yip1-like protein